MPAMRTRDMSRSLDVTDTTHLQTLTAPSLQLISPTPRTLIFPTSHNLSLGFSSGGDSPYSSPSASPFEGPGGGGVYDGAGAGYDGAGGYEMEFQGHKAPNGLEFQPGAFEVGYGYQHQQEVQHAPFDFDSSQLPQQQNQNQTQQHYATFNSSQTSFHAYDASRNSSNLSLAIPELPAFSSYGGGGQSPSDGETGSVRSESPCGSVQSNHKRRKSTSSSSSTTRDKSAERRPKKGDADYVKRPENAFILFRRAACEERQALEARQAALGGAPAKKQRQADLSKAISEKWRNLSAEEKREWDEKAQEAKKQHAAAHPDYVYRPERKSKNRSSASTTSRKNSLSRARRSSEDSSSTEGGSGPHLSVFVPMHPSTSSSSHSHSHSHSHSTSTTSFSPLTSNAGGADRHGRNGGRSLSAPRPYHRIDVPRVSHGVYMEGRQGSEPSGGGLGSPSLVPLINEHSRGGGWDYVPVGRGGGEYPSMSMVSSLFTQNANATTTAGTGSHTRKSSAPGPLQQVASSMGAVPSPLSMISSRASLPHTSSFPGPHTQFHGHGQGQGGSQGQEHLGGNGGEGGGSDSSSESGSSPYTPSSSAPTHAHAFGLMPSFEETLLDPPTTFDSSLLDHPSLTSSSPLTHNNHNDTQYDNGMMDGGMSMEGMMATLDGEMHRDAYGGEGAFGGWDWPVGEGVLLDNEWDVNSIPLASLSPSSSLSPTSLHSSSLSSANSMTSPTTSMSSAMSSAMSPSSLASPGSANANQLAAQFGGLGVGGGKGMFEGMEMEYGADPTLIGVGGYDDILSGGAFA